MYDRLEARVDRVETKIDHGFAQIGGQLDTIDHRLDEIELIPSITKHIDTGTPPEASAKEIYELAVK